tara:strand:- start:4 stop:132 length:129 start_codon:yes stop_codon:yes gene_type:complete
MKNTTEINNDVYPLTAEEFQQSEKVTSQDVLDVMNAGDLEVE